MLVPSVESGTCHENGKVGKVWRERRSYNVQMLEELEAHPELFVWKAEILVTAQDITIPKDFI